MFASDRTDLDIVDILIEMYRVIHKNSPNVMAYCSKIGGFGQNQKSLKAQSYQVSEFLSNKPLLSDSFCE